MTYKKPGHNLPTEGSTNVPTHETLPLPTDGPEGHLEEEPVRGFEEEDLGAPNANPNNTSTKSIAENHQEVHYATPKFGETTPDSPRVKIKPIGVSPSTFGSPFAYDSYPNKQDFFVGLLAESTRTIFYQVVTQASVLRKQLSTNLALTNDGFNAHFCVLEECSSSSADSDSGEKNGSDEPKLRLHCFPSDEKTWSLPLDNLAACIDSSSATTREKPNAEMTIEMRRVQHRGTREIEYYVVNKNFHPLYINDTLVAPAMIAGPLPDFAVFEIEQSSFFWWRTAAALDYMPVVKRKRASEDHDGEPSRKASRSNTPKTFDTLEVSPRSSIPDSSSSLQVFSDSKNWLDEYRRRLKICEKRPIKFTSLITDLHPPHQFPAGEMHDIDIILAIGAVWLGLIEANVFFAFANSDLFSFARSMRMVGMHAVKGTHQFIMPLLFNEELQTLPPESEEDTAEPLEPAFSAFQRGEEERHRDNIAAAEKAIQEDPGNKNKPMSSLEEQELQNKDHKGGIGHFMLAVAEKVSRDGPNTIKDVLAKKALVRLRFMDSADGFVDRGTIRRVARNTVRNSGWLGDIWPGFDATEEDWADVISQSGNRCGEHTILNAWAYMLGIPLATTRERALGPSSYNEVRRMIVLALRGQLDSFTIRAWMQHSKYAVNEPLSQLQQAQIENPDSPNNFPSMVSVALNESAFNEAVNKIYSQEQTENEAHATVWSAISKNVNGATARPLGRAPRVTTKATLPSSAQATTSTASSTDATSPRQVSSANNPSPAQASHPRPSTWKQKLARGLAYHKGSRTRNHRTTQDAVKEPSVIPSYSNLADYDVVLGIAPIWEGLKRLGRPEFDFTYAGTDLFAPGGEQESFGAVGSWSRFIMPLFFSPIDSEELEDQEGEVNSVGHLLLCVAELVDERPMTVQLEIFDSYPDSISMEVILLKAREIIRHSGWLDRNGSKTKIVYRPHISRQTPRQVGINTCGLHVILNAWAYMLNIPIHPGPLRRAQHRNTDSRFLDRGLEIVNFALAGFMDSATIQAYFNEYGYSAEQRFGDPARAVISVHAIGMNQEKLLRTLRRRKMGYTIATARAQRKAFPAADMTFLTVQNGLSREQAWTALVMGQGNVDRAMDWHFGWDVFGEIPRPEDVLSPKTPEGRKS